MKLIPLTKGLFAKVDDSDYDFLSQWKWCANWKYNSFYALRHITLNGKRSHLLMHRAILCLTLNDKVSVDHIDNDTLNNQRCNIRIATCSQNNNNARKRSGCSSIYKGVNRRGNRWRATIKVNGKKLHIGMFSFEEDAAMAYDAEATKYFGEYAKLNFTPQ